MKRRGIGRLAAGVFAALAVITVGWMSRRGAPTPPVPAVSGANRLAHEKSPYLLQHAHNPVDWYPWGEEAFKAARKQDKPIFLSIGYATCHWCHVMERESFEDAEVAALMNRDFIAIKVDREERPDVDQVYMGVTQAMTGSGGWPMTVVMTPDKKPFFAGTYFPKTGRFGRPGMMELLPGLAKVWKEDQPKVRQAVGQVEGLLAQSTSSKAGGALGAETLDQAYGELESRYDADRGGFGSAPKFPVPHQLRFLLRYHRRTGNPKALAMVEHTLRQMRLGGIYDQVGFGFHRYSTDPQWLLPHFEKMLYDQALHIMAYTEAYQATRKEEYRRTAEEIIAYVLRDMTSPEGGFYSAEDADSEGEEGLFYLWTAEELRKVLGREDGEFIAKLFGVEKGGNFADQSSGQKTGHSILHLKAPLRESTAKRVEALRAKLFKAREPRIHPLKDDKVLTDWNGLMISALAMAGQAFQVPRYAEAAKRSADFVLANLMDKRGRLVKRWREGHAALPAVLEDYAFFIGGLIDLYQATFETRYLEEAIRLAGDMDGHYWDSKAGGYFLNADDGEELIVRPKEIYDGAIPSGNSVAALDLIRLSRLTGDLEHEKRADRLIKAFSGSLQVGGGSSHTQLLLAVDFSLGPSFEIVIAGMPGAPDVGAMLRSLHIMDLPNKVVIFRPEEPEAAITKLAEFTAAQKAMGGKATAYVCRNFACDLPTTDRRMMKRLILEKGTH